MLVIPVQVVDFEQKHVVAQVLTKNDIYLFDGLAPIIHHFVNVFQTLAMVRRALNP
jgi:hypothetical protein